MKNKILIALIVLLTALLAAWPTVGAPNLTNFTDHVHIQTAGGTATPALRVNQNGNGKIVEFSDGGTPVFSINNGGGIVASTILTQGATITDLSVSGTSALSGAVTLSSTLTLEGVAFSGPVVFGSVTATDGLTVTHGLGTTPTTVLVSPSWIGDGSTITQTVYISNVGSSTFSLEFTTGEITTTTAYWLAGR